jgi:hypothetical protein
MPQPVPFPSVRRVELLLAAPLFVSLVSLVSVAGARAAGAQGAQGAQRGAPTGATLERLLTRRLQQLKPDGMTERDVLFQSVRAESAGGGSYPYRVTLLVRDYGPGYPANHFYGETCVARFEAQLFTLEPDGAGGWSVAGRMTPDLARRTCTRNPSAGVSSVPLAGLSGASAADGPVEAPPGTPAEAPGAGDGVAAGAYACWANGEARPLMNFSVRGDGRYVGADGQSGAFRLDPATRRITFTGGALDGVLPPGFSAVYHIAQGRPAVSFRGRTGAEAAFCERR